VAGSGRGKIPGDGRRDEGRCGRHGPERTAGSGVGWSAAGNWTCVLHDVTDKGVVIVALEDTHQPAPRIQKHGDLGPGETLLPWSSVRAIKLSEAEQSE
jgi:hypothetical protein